MSTDPTFTVEWTVPADEWGDVAHEDDDSTARETAHPTAGDGRAESRSDPSTETASYAGRDPENLPPAPVLAAHVDALRADREAKERELDAVRERYETIIDARNEEIERLRGQRSGLHALLDRLGNLF
jgi:flagellar motility protein MotE (MotC chaperone)